MIEALPVDRPAWIDPWIQKPLAIPSGILAVLQLQGRRSPEVRDLMVRFPPAAIVGCGCTDPRCRDRFGIVARYHAGMSLLVVSRDPVEYVADVFHPVQVASVRLLACRSFLTPELMGALVDGPDA